MHIQIPYLLMLTTKIRGQLGSYFYLSNEYEFIWPTRPTGLKPEMSKHNSKFSPGFINYTYELKLLNEKSNY